MRNTRLFQITFFITSLIPCFISGMWNAFESSTWNWLQKQKNKPLDPLNQWAHDIVFDSKDEIVEFDAKDFDKPSYVVDAKYDENLNRIN